MKLNKLIKRREKVNDENWVKVGIAKKTNESRLTIEELEHNAWSEEKFTTEEVSILLTKHLTTKASRYSLPVPSRDEVDMWQQCSHASNQYVLTNAGITGVRSIVRNHEKSKRDTVLVYIAAFTGILGTATGLLSIIKQ